MYDRVLLPTDGSPEMIAVVEHAVSLSLAHDATLRTIYVVDTATLARLPMEASFETVGELLDDEGRAATEAVAERAGEGVTVEEIVVDGIPSREIVREAEEADCDAIVMGTHGRGGIGRLLLGSVAERVVRTAPVPVLTVPVDGSVTETAGA